MALYLSDGVKADFDLLLLDFELFLLYFIFEVELAGLLFSLATSNPVVSESGVLRVEWNKRETNDKSEISVYCIDMFVHIYIHEEGYHEVTSVNGQPVDEITRLFLTVMRFGAGKRTCEGRMRHRLARVLGAERVGAE